MKIGFDANKAFLGTGKKGSYSKSVIRILSQHFPENHYILYASKIKKDPALKDLLAPDHVEVRTPAFIVTKMNMGNIWRSTILGNTALADKVDVLHGLNNKLPLVVSKKLRTVVTVHNLHFIRYPHLFHNFDVEIYKRRYKHACKVANKIIATSTQTAEDIASFLGIAPDKIEVIPQTCHRDFKKEYVPYELRRLCDQYQLPEDFILTTSKDDIFDNSALTALKALAYMKDKLDIPLVVVGNIPKNYYAELIKIAEKEKIANRLMILGDIPVQDMAMIYQLCKLYLHVSTYPCDTTPIKEALYSRVPVISSRIPEFIEAGGLSPIYIQTGNERELAFTIQNLLNNISLTSNMIDQGAVQAQEYDDELIAKKLYNLYYSIVEDNAVSP